MKFLFPTFLFALFAISIPIIIHLFSFRRYKTVYFSHVGFLKDIKKESRKKSRLKQLLILIARILTVSFLVFAFAQPYIPVNRETNKHKSQTVAVYVDNSFSMNALSEQGQLLEVARNKALEICLAYPAGTKFRLFSNDLEPKHQHRLNKEQFIQQVSELQASPKVFPLSIIYNLFAQSNSQQETGTDKYFYIISDFQNTIVDIENFADQKIYSYFLPLKPNEVANLFIDSCWVEVPAHRLNQEEEIFVRIKNSSNQDYQNLPLKLYINDSIKSITNFSVSAQNEITANLKFINKSSGSQKGKIEITDYPFTHDNNWYISYFVEPNLKALAIFDKNNASEEGLNYISALFENDDYILLDQMNEQSLQISRLKEYNTIFLVNLENYSSGFLNELEKVATNGSSVVIFPGTTGNISVHNNLLTRFGANKITSVDTTRLRISEIDFENDFFKNVFQKKEENPVLPEINHHLKFEKNIRTNETLLLKLQNKDKALSVKDFKKGKIWVFGFPLDKKNQSFARDILFVPTLYNIVLHSLPSQQISLTVGQNSFYDLPKNKNISLNSALEIVNFSSNQRFIPEKTISSQGVRIGFGENINEAGHFLVQNNDETITSIAFNFNRKESDLRYLTQTELEEKLEMARLKNATVLSNVTSSFSEIFDEIQNGKQLWKWCILIALFFILAEVLISRFWK